MYYGKKSKHCSLLTYTILRHGNTAAAESWEVALLGLSGQCCQPRINAVTLVELFPICLFFFFISSTLGEKDRAVMYVKECTAYVFLEEFYGFWPSFKSLIHFKFILCMVLGKDLVSSFYL